MGWESKRGSNERAGKQKEDLVCVFVRPGPYYVAQAGPKSYLPASLTEGIGLQVYININSLHSYPQFLVGFACLH